MKNWFLIQVEKNLTESLGGLVNHKERLVKVLNKTYRYTFDDKTLRVYQDYFEIVSPDGNEPTRKEKKNFADYFMEEFSEFELLKSQKGLYSLFHYNKKKGDMGSEKLRRLYE